MKCALKDAMKIKEAIKIRLKRVFPNRRRNTQVKIMLIAIDQLKRLHFRYFYSSQAEN